MIMMIIIIIIIIIIITIISWRHISKEAEKIKIKKELNEFERTEEKFIIEKIWFLKQINIHIIFCHLKQ